MPVKTQGFTCVTVYHYANEEMRGDSERFGAEDKELEA
jgi:hypothetical protein